MCSSDLVEQQAAMVVFKPAHLVRDRGLGQAERLGSPRESAMGGDGMDRTELNVLYRRLLSPESIPVSTLSILL